MKPSIQHDDLSIILGFEPSQVLIRKINSIDQSIDDTKRDAKIYEDLSSGLWNLADKTSDKKTFLYLLGFTSRKREVIDIANQYQSMSTRAISKVYRLRKDKDDLLKAEFTKNKLNKNKK